MIEITKDYVESIHIKKGTLELQEELEQCLEVLKINMVFKDAPPVY